MQAVGGTTLNADEAAAGADGARTAPAVPGEPAAGVEPAQAHSVREPAPAVQNDQAEADGPAGRPGFSARAVTVLGAVAVLAVLVDQLVKELSTKNLIEGEPDRILGGLVYLSLLRNSGAAFSLGSGYTWVFPLVTVVVVGWIGWMTLRLRSVPWAIALGLVLGGALGNLGDRLFRAPGVFQGHVVDMISLFGPYGEYFAVFNIADSCLSVGVVLAVLLELTGRQRDGSLAGRKKVAA